MSSLSMSRVDLEVEENFVPSPELSENSPVCFQVTPHWQQLLAFCFRGDLTDIPCVLY